MNPPPARSKPASGSFSCNISISPGVNLAVVRATDLAGNIAQVNLHLTFTAPFAAPTSLQVSPNAVNMLIGQSQQFSAVDQSGHTRPDASWSVDNASIASLSTDPTTPSLLTALTSGTVTL